MFNNWSIAKIGATSKNIGLATQVVIRHSVDDPILLFLQILRKVPFSVSLKVAHLLMKVPNIGVQEVARQVLGFDGLSLEAEKLLNNAPISGRLKRLEKRLIAEVAVTYGQVDYRDSGIPLLTRARAAWDSGAIDEALELAEHSSAKSYRSRLEGEAMVLRPDWQVSLQQKNKITAETQIHRNILHLLTNSMPVTQSGYTIRTQRLLEALVDRKVSINAITRIGYPVMIGELTAEKIARSGKITYRRVLPARLASTLPKRLEQWGNSILDLFADEKPILIHTTTNYTNGLVAQALAKAWDIPWVYEVRGIMEETWVSRKKTKATQQEAECSQRFQRIRARETQLMKKADHVVTLSETMKGLLIERGVPAEKISVIPNAVDESLFDFELLPASARKKLGLETSGFWVGSVSSLVEYEGFDTLLQAVAQLRRKGLDVRVLLVGDGVARGPLEKLASSLAQDPQVGEFAVFMGKIRPEMAYIAHQALDVFAVPRRDNRVCRSVTPLKPIEAMALGRPVVVSDLPPLAELVQNGITGPTGLLAEAENHESFAQAFEDLMHHDGTRAAFAREGRVFARTRTWAENAGKLESMYRKLIENFASE